MPEKYLIFKGLWPITDLRNPGFIRVLHGCLLSRFRFLRVVLCWKERPMPNYRAYLINRENRVSSFRPIDADTDAEALKAARQFVDRSDVEVWHLDRKIGRLEHGKK
jgi:hypothetical protein